MNKNPLHIKRSRCRLVVLTFSLLLAVLQSPAQHHRKHAARHTGSMPDSVNTADEEIKPFSSNEATTKFDTTVKVDTTGSSTEAPPTEDASATTSSPEETEQEAPLVLRHVPDTATRSWKRARDFAYANDSTWWKEEARQEDNSSGKDLSRLFSSKGFVYFIYIFLGSVLLYALYKIIRENNLRFFYRKPVKLGEGPAGEADLPEEDIDQLLKKALEQQEHRQATRYLYLKTLRMLEARQLIRWHIQATDEEYARQLDGLPQGQSFRWLMAAYERVWYGKVFPDDQQFSRLSQYFQDFQTSIDHSRRA